MKDQISTKRGEGLSMTVIVVAAVALIVLIVLIIVFSSRMSIFNKGVNSCEDKGGHPYSGPTRHADCVQAGGTPSGPYFEKESGKERVDTICCLFTTSTPR